MDERDKWWLEPLMSYGYSPRQAVSTGLLQQTVPNTSPAIGLAGPLPTYEVPAYQPVSAPFAQPQWNTDAVADTVVADALENQARAAYEALPATPVVEPTVSIGVSDATTLPDPTFGLAANDPNLQGITPFSTASTTPAQINAGMADVELPFFERFPLAQQALSQGVVDSIQHSDAIYGNETIPSPKDTAGRKAWKEVVGALPTTGLLGDVSNWAISKVMQHGIPFTGFSGDDIETATTAEGMTDVLNNLIILDAKKSGVPKDDLIASIVTGVNPLIQTSEDQLAAVLRHWYQTHPTQQAIQQGRDQEEVPQTG